MASVTQRIAQVKQPYGGYVKVSQFDMIDLGGGLVPFEGENVHSSVVGMAVDYLTRFACGASIAEAFKISIYGSASAEQFGMHGAVDEMRTLISGITGVDATSIVNACKAVTYDVWYRSPLAAKLGARGADETNPDNETIRHISLMVKRGIKFFETYGPVIKDGFTFGDGYTATVDVGDGDFLTSDTLWDFKVSKKKPSSKNTLQLLMYWIMGQHSSDPIFNAIDHIGLFNPRLNAIWRLDMEKVSKDIISTVERDVICYR